MSCSYMTEGYNPMDYLRPSIRVYMLKATLLASYFNVLIWTFGKNNDVIMLVTYDAQHARCRSYEGHSVFFVPGGFLRIDV